MGFEDLSEIETLQGSFSFIYVIITLSIGILIVSKYRKVKHIETITVGLSLIFIASPWWGSSLSFIAYGFFNIEISDTLYLTLGCVFNPVTLFFWLYSFFKFIYPNSIKKMVIIYLVINIPYEIGLIYFIATNISIIGRMDSIFNSVFNLYPTLFSIGSLTVLVITGLIFGKKSIKSNNQNVQWKGRFILIAFGTFIFGALTDTLIGENSMLLIIIRVVLVFSAIMFYFGFFLPDRIANLLIKEKK